MSLTDIRLMLQMGLLIRNRTCCYQVRLFFVMAIINPMTVNTIIRTSKSVIGITSFSAVDWRCRHLPAERQSTAYRQLVKLTYILTYGKYF